MRHLFQTIAIATFLLVSQSCTTADQAHGHLLQPSEVVSKKQQSPNLLVIDVRTPEEYAAGHIEGATLINWYDGQFEKQVKTFDKSQPVLVYCAVGGRSGQAYAKLVQLGFKEVYDMKGGFDAWRLANLPIAR